MNNIPRNSHNLSSFMTLLMAEMIAIVFGIDSTFTGSFVEAGISLVGMLYCIFWIGVQCFYKRRPHIETKGDA